MDLTRIFRPDVGISGADNLFIAKFHDFAIYHRARLCIVCFSPTIFPWFLMSPDALEVMLVTLSNSHTELLTNR